VRAGGVVVTGLNQAAMPTVRFTVESYTPSTALSFTVAHDLMIGPLSAGPLVGDVAEAALIREWEHLSGRAVGVYRNADVSRAMDLGRWDTGPRRPWLEVHPRLEAGVRRVARRAAQ